MGLEEIVNEVKKVSEPERRYEPLVDKGKEEYLENLARKQIVKLKYSSDYKVENNKQEVEEVDEVDIYDEEIFSNETVERVIKYELMDKQLGTGTINEFTTVEEREKFEKFKTLNKAYMMWKYSLPVGM
jgi:hypothetical protein